MDGGCLWRRKGGLGIGESSQATQGGRESSSRGVTHARSLSLFSGQDVGGLLTQVMGCQQGDLS